MYVIKDLNKKQLWTVACGLTAASVVAASAHGALLEDWQFNDAASTQLTGLANAGTAGSAFTEDATNVVTDGTDLVFTQGDNVFRVASPDQNLSAGIVTMEFFYSSATIAGGDTSGANVGFGLRDVGAGANLFVVRIQRQGGDLRLQHRIGATNTTLEDFNVTSLTDLAVRIVADLDADTMDVFWTLGAGAEMSSLGIAITDGDFDAVRAQANTNATDWGTGDSVAVDFLTVDYVPEPGSLALLGLGGLMLVRRRRN